jgi:hypothetical protein
MTRLHEALETDVILSSSQVRRHYGLVLDGNPEPGLLTHMPSIGRTKQSSARPIRIYFLSRHRRFAGLKGHRQRHIMGLAEMRHFLGATCQEWATRDLYELQGSIPDARWHHRHDVAAIEFDAGGYERDKIIIKAKDFQQYDHQIWGAATERRVRYLRETFAESGLTAHVILACWY